MKKNLLIGLAVASLVLCNGCALLVLGGAAAAGAGTVLYVNGELKDSVSYSLNATHTATLEAMRKLKFAIVSDAKDAINSKTIARTATDTKIEVNLTKQSPSVTEIRIRVGTFGDEQLSRQILDEIKAHL